MELIFSRKADKDLKRIEKEKRFNKRVNDLLEILERDPFEPPYEKLKGVERYSRRINIQHRLVYEIDKTKKEVYILSMWSHYEF